MKALLAFSKDSAKKAFVKLRKEQYFFCGALKENVEITKNFLYHVLFHQAKQRSWCEIMERILIFPFLEEIIQEGQVLEKREEKEIIFFQISKDYLSYSLTAIIHYTIKTKKYILLSCFKNFDHKKKNPSLVFPKT